MISILIMSKPQGRSNKMSNDTSEFDYRFQCERMSTEHERQRPSVLFRPALRIDGNQYCVLYGTNLVEGCAGFGDSVEEAMQDFDFNWSKRLPVFGKAKSDE
jgi:hypothetical protein